MQRDQALRLVYDAIDVVNQQLPASRRLAKSPETIVVGPSGALDSLGIVTFVLALEERVGEAIGAPIQLLDETTIADAGGAFRTVDTVARLIEALPHP